MAIDRVNAVLIGRVKDEHGFSAELLEDPLTNDRFLAYEPETWWERGRYLEHLKAMGKDNTPRNAWPGRHRKV